MFVDQCAHLIQRYRQEQQQFEGARRRIDEVDHFRTTSEFQATHLVEQYRKKNDEASELKISLDGAGAAGSLRV